MNFVSLTPLMQKYFNNIICVCTSTLRFVKPGQYNNKQKQKFRNVRRKNVLISQQSQ